MACSSPPTACAASASACNGNLVNLPSTGVYGIVVRPAAGATGGFDATLSSDFGGTLAVGGPAVPVTLDRPGRNARLTVTGTPGQTVRLNWSAVAIVGADGKSLMYFNTPTGAAFASTMLTMGWQAVTTFRRCRRAAATRYSSTLRRGRL